METLIDPVQEVMEFGQLVVRRKQISFDLIANKMPKDERLKLLEELYEIELSISRLQGGQVDQTVKLLNQVFA